MITMTKSLISMKTMTTTTSLIMMHTKKEQGKYTFLFSEIEEKTNASTLKSCHFKASRDIITNFGSVTLGNNISE